MLPSLQPRWRQTLQHAVCFFCLLRPFWGWLDRKAEPEAAPAPEAMQPVRSNGLGDWIAPPQPSAPPQTQGEPE